MMIEEYYRNKAILITGCTGFLGIRSSIIYQIN